MVQDNGYVRVSDQYVRLQQGLAMLAKHMPHAVLEDLQSWREAAKKAATEGNNRGVLSSDLIVKRQLLAVRFPCHCPCLLRCRGTPYCGPESTTVTSAHAVHHSLSGHGCRKATMCRSAVGRCGHLCHIL